MTPEGPVTARPALSLGSALVWAVVMAGPTFDSVRDVHGPFVPYLGHAIAALVGGTYFVRVPAWRTALVVLNLRPEPSWQFWIKRATAVLFLVLALAWVELALVYRIGSEPWRARSLLEMVDGARVVEVLVVAPVLEELVHRFLLCTILAGMFATMRAVVVSGLFFALIHFLRGNLDVSNAVAGFLFAWAFLRSRSLIVPVLFHASGNLLALTFQIGLAQYFGYDWKSVLFSWHGRSG